MFHDYRRYRIERRPVLRILIYIIKASDTHIHAELPAEYIGIYFECIWNIEVDPNDENGNKQHMLGTKSN